ncbi:S41 family peptidase [Pedobacter deserti]|uniref:S41 family peptidase n=1 Tax=Pedobacter deserti TaxID=2817382 RepID=UPI002109F147|nr:S41 family peptidase [Pedobacter sp. SYSU D00382]
MKNLLILFFALLMQNAVWAQGTNCNCRENLDKIISKTESNYAGFPDKVNGSAEKKYAQLVVGLRSEATGISSAKTCYELLRRYIRFFEDKHFSLTYQPNGDDQPEMLSADAAYFNYTKQDTGPEGIWINPDSSLTLGVKRFPGQLYKAVVLRASDKNLKPGLVYFTLKPHAKGYLLQQYNVFTTTDMYAQQRGDLLQLWNFAMYKRISGRGLSRQQTEEFESWRNNNNGLQFKVLDEETSYIKIPTFFNNDSKIQRLVAANDAKIRGSKYLIIDLRGNGGGNSGWSNLLPYVMTNPIQQDSPLLRVSPDNTAIKRAELEPIVTNPVSEEMKKYFPDDYVAALRRVYEELPQTKQTFYAVPGLTIPVDSLLKLPSKVALVTDELCGSSAEYFFHLMAQSKKTLRYGSNTVGMMDYEGPSQVTPLPYAGFVLMIPVSKSGWTDTQPIDKVGFKPDIPLHIPKSQWIDYISKDLKKRK